jgi:hypothetical protein
MAGILDATTLGKRADRLLVRDNGARHSIPVHPRRIGARSTSCKFLSRSEGMDSNTRVCRVKQPCVKQQQDICGRADSTKTQPRPV